MRKATMLLLGLAAAAQAIAASTAPLPASRLVPEPRQVLIARTVVQIARKRHYPQETLDAKLAHAVLDEYFDVLDPNRFYLTNNAIRGFHQTYDERLAGAIRHGNLKPAFAIYRYYLGQVRSQIHYALKLLGRKTNFAVQASFRFEREHAPWVPNQSALDQLWRERVKNDALVFMLRGRSWTEAATVLTRRYRHTLAKANQTTPDEVFGAYMTAYMQALDPHSSYFTGRQVQQFRNETDEQRQGIGAQLEDRNGYVTVVHVPAAENGELEPGDRIVGVGEGKSGKINDVVGWDLDDVIKRIRGPKGTIVRLCILPADASPGGAVKTVMLTRKVAGIPGDRAHARTALVTIANHTYKIGIIEIPSFYANFGDAGTTGKLPLSVTDDVRALLARLKADKVSGVLLDLRDNGGGLLQQAAALTGLFIPGGPVVRASDRSSHTQQLSTPNGETVAWNGPLAVLVNRFSASATEIFAGALEDYHRALVLGSRTWGNGTVQTLVSLRQFLPGFRAGEMKLTVGQFFRVNGSSTQLRGVTPNVAIPSSINDRALGEDTYPNALPWKSMAPADYKPVRDFVSRLLPKLRKYFEFTVQKAPGYRLFERQIALQRRTDANTTVPLSREARERDLAKHRTQTVALQNAWRKLEGKPVSKDPGSADDSNFSPSDVPLEVGEMLLGEYINLLPHKRAPFKDFVTILSTPGTSSCAAPLEATRRHGRCVDRPSKLISPPGTGTKNGG